MLIRAFYSLPLLIAIACQSSFDTTQVGQVSGVGGAWVNARYIQLLTQTKSPRTVQSLAIPSMILMPHTIGDTGSFIGDFHDGAPFILGKSGKVMERYDLARLEKYGDFHINDGRLTMHGQEYIFISDSLNDYRVGETFLFSGTYSYDDQFVSFSSEGMISGLDNFSHYAVMLDYFDVGRNLDQVEMGPNQDSMEAFGFSFSKDTLTIYKLNCIESDARTCYTVELGETMFRLIKQ